MVSCGGGGSDGGLGFWYTGATVSLCGFLFCLRKREGFGRGRFISRGSIEV